jgi:hypothetical protein
MVRELDQDELIDRWTPVGDEQDLVAGKRGATRLGFPLSHTRSADVYRTREICRRNTRFSCRQDHQLGILAQVSSYQHCGQTEQTVHHLIQDRQQKHPTMLHAETAHEKRRSGRCIEYSSLTRMLARAAQGDVRIAMSSPAAVPASIGSAPAGRQERRRQ